MDESLIDDPIDFQEFADTVVIFDDVDVLKSKKIREEVCKLANQGLEIGRHYRINMVVTNHLPSNGKETRRVLNESSSFTYFPHSANAKIRYFLEDYLGIDKKIIIYFQKQSTRAVTIFQKITMIYLGDHWIGILSAFGEDP